MLDAIGKFLIQDVLGDSFTGLLVRGQSLKARRLKATGWVCLAASVTSFMTIVLWPDAINATGFVALGILMAMAALGCGFCATLINTCVINAPPKADLSGRPNECEKNASLPTPQEGPPNQAIHGSGRQRGK
jgi:hypothetical protein